MRTKDLVKLITPPIFVEVARHLIDHGFRGVYGLSGNYSNWAEAKGASTGYDNEDILEKTRVALLKVKNGEAVFERDSVIFDEIQYAWPVLAGLLWVAARCKGPLNVMDFGGSLGSTYFQNLAFLSSLPKVHWNIVEQPRHVEIGRAWFADESLHFYPTISDCLVDTRPNVVLLSSVLQYLEYPFAILDQVLSLPCECIIIDRTPFWSGLNDRLCVQRVPPEIYKASYPSWIFARDSFFSRLNENWLTMTLYDNPDRLAGPADFIYQGAIIVRRTHLS